MERIDPFKELLRKSGYKATAPRRAILALIKKNKTPMSAQQIINALPGAIDQATVYRTVKSLKEKGIIRPVDLRHNHAHYELANTTDHHHLVCLRCGKIENVEHRGVKTMERTILQDSKYFSEIKEHALEFYGICKACAKKEYRL